MFRASAVLHDDHKKKTSKEKKTHGTKSVPFLIHPKPQATTEGRCKAKAIMFETCTLCEACRAALC